MMRNVLLVALGGAVGAAGRFLITHWMHRRWSTHFPVGTLTVNVLGCLLIGVAVQASRRRALAHVADAAGHRSAGSPDHVLDIRPRHLPLLGRTRLDVAARSTLPPTW